MSHAANNGPNQPAPGISAGHSRVEAHGRAPTIHPADTNENTAAPAALHSQLAKMVEEYTKEIRDKNQFTQVILDSSPDLIVVYDKHLRHLLLNKCARAEHHRVFGHDIAQKPAEAAPEIRNPVVHRALTDALRGIPSRISDFYAPGNDSYYDTDYIPIRNDTEGVYAVMVIARDVTARVKADAAVGDTNKLLLQQNQFIQTIFNATQEWIAVYDKDMRLIMVNDACLRLMGKIKEQVINKTFHELYPEGLGSKPHNDLVRAMAGETIVNEAYQSVISGRWIRNYLTPLKDGNGKVLAVLAVAQDLTETIQSQEETKRTQRHFSLLFNVSPVAISLSRRDNGAIIDVNKAWEHLFRTSKLQALGRSTADLGLSCHALNKAHEGDYHTYEEQFLYADGSRAYLYVSDTTIELEEVQCLLTAYIDITERKATEEKIVRLAKQLAERNHELKEAQRLSHIGSWEWDMVRNVITWSDELYNIFGVNKTGFDTSYENFLQLIHPEDREYTNEVITAAVRELKPYEFIHRTIRPDGVVRTVLGKGEVYTDDDGRAVRMAGTSQDITQAAEMTAALEQQNAELEKMNKELASFSYIASHDLQEPLRKIQTFVGLILEHDGPNLSTKGTDYFKRIRSASGRMQNLINALLDYSRIQGNDPVFQRISLATVIDNARSVLDELAEKKNATFHIADPLPYLRAIPLQLTQLFQNLFENALKYCKPDVPPLITVSCDKVPAPPGNDNTAGYWRILVADNGIGFNPEYATRIFELFQRLHGNSTYEGSGIGLAICKKITDIHGGTISATSEPGKGATFQVLLPA